MLLLLGFQASSESAQGRVNVQELDSFSTQDVFHSWRRCSLPRRDILIVAQRLRGASSHVLQTKVYLNKVPATSIAASFPKGPGIAPGDKLPLVVIFTTADGKVFVTEGQGHGKILWQDLNVSATVAGANNKGVLSLPSDPRLSEGKLPHVTITAPSHPDLKA